MKKSFGALCITACLVAFSSAVARADISEDLKFCSTLKNGKERLACYDAAARIEKRQPVHLRSSSLALTRNTVTVSSPNIPLKKEFAGAYVVGVGGYDFGGDNPGSLPFAPPTLPMMQGALVGAAAGWNFQSENILFGLEGRALYSMSKAERSDSFVGTPISFPYWSGWCQSFGDPFCTTNASAPQFPFGFPYRSAFALTNKLERTAAFDASARFGSVIADSLIYAKFGGGAEMIKSTSVSDSTARLTCNNPVSVVIPTGPDSGDAYVVGCGSITGGTVSVRTANTIQPYLTVGLGLEKNFGRLFARVEGEVQTHFMPAGINGLGAVYYTTQITAGLGYRF
ncbi:hypothetical protein ASC80_06370 [Afipia sp. Root123D2]|uniref:hypothetical protein n=1 Tax=Afipia sp. Root123D2 TaxID=1736436 RepID=UPI0006F2761A|nr:hypothetical protein [Afipia sp. Root123D2]KQW22948.1 hypothetical protein ASC80_06370 [Afipia sp. Root123D2]